MADAKTNYAEALVLDWLLTNSAVTRPTAWYVALFTAAPGETGGGTESTGGSYARQSATFTRSGQTVSNAGVLSFANMPASTITHFAVFDAVTSGNMLYHGPLTASKTLDAGDTAQFAIGALTISEL